MMFKSNYIICVLFFLAFNVCYVNAQSSVLLDSLTLDTLKAITTLEEALKYPDKVVKLVLKRDRLQKIPAEVFTFTNLQYLDLSKNQLTEIPAEIGQLKKLQYLTFEKNKLESIPPQLGELSNLYYLNIGQNEIYSLPPEIGNLENLKVLDAWLNNLGTFPPELAKLKNLKVLDLRSILISESNEKKIKGMLPNTKIHFSNHCACQN